MFKQINIIMKIGDNMKKLNINIDKYVRNILIGLVFISLMIIILNFTNSIYSDHDTTKLQNVLNIINGPVMWIDSILIYLFSLIYIVSAIQSKQEVVLKVSFSVFAILFNMITMNFFINMIAEVFGIL